MKKRSIIIVFVIMIFALLLGGCIMNRSEKVLKHLEKKYNEPFVIDESFSGGMDVKYDEFHCYPASNPDNRFAVYINTDGDISDDYFGILAKPKYEELVRSKLDDYFNEYKVIIIFNERAFDDRFIDPDKLELYIKEEPRSFWTNIFVATNNEDIDEKVFEKICAEMHTVLEDFYIDIMVCNEQEYLNANKDNYPRIISLKEYITTVKGNELRGTRIVESK